MQLIKILSGLLTPTIAILAVYIAYRQYQMVKAKLKLDLYEKRLKIFHEFKRFIHQRATVWEFEGNERGEFERNTIECKFLFGKDIIDFRENLINKGKDLTKKNREKNRKISENNIQINDPDELIRLQNECSEISSWFDFEQRNIETRFNKYLDFRKL